MRIDDLKGKRKILKFEREHYIAPCGELGLEELWTCRKKDYSVNG
jgi:hypothetical protein